MISVMKINGRIIILTISWIERREREREEEIAFQKWLLAIGATIHGGGKSGQLTELEKKERKNRTLWSNP